MKVSINGKTIGGYNEKTNVFEKHVKTSKHLLRILDAWGIDEKLFSEFLLPKNATVRIHDTEGGVIYILSAEDIQRFGQNRTYGSHGTQKFVPRKYWVVVTEEQGRLI